MIASEPNGAIAVFENHERAHVALEALRTSGFDMTSVSVFGPGQPKQVVAPELDRTAEHGGEVAKFWGMWGAIVGAATGGVVIGVPVIAAIVGLGPFAPILAAIAVTTTAVGAVTTALVGYGVHEKHARLYEAALHAGKTVVVAHSNDLGRLKDARACLAQAMPEHLDVHGLRALGGS